MAKKTSKPLNMEQRIIKSMELGPLVALYFVAGINTLKERVDNSTDDEVVEIFSSFFHPQQVRSNIERIQQILNSPNYE